MPSASFAATLTRTQKEGLRRLGITAGTDLLFHFPREYQDRTKVQTVASVEHQQQCQLELEVTSARPVFFGRKHLALSARDSTGAVNIRLYFFTKDLIQKLQPGAMIRCYGKLAVYGNKKNLFHPQYQIVTPATPRLPTTLTPVYPLTAGISQKQISRWITAQLKETTPASMPELLPPALRTLLNAGVPSLTALEALRLIHQPDASKTDADSVRASKAYMRLTVEELLAWCVGLMLNQSERQSMTAPRLRDDRSLVAQWKEKLPFSLTSDQDLAIAEITADLAMSKPMMRVLQGDVGCGKTAVATAAMLTAVASDMQAVLLAPTEILAEQHALTLHHQLTPLGVRVEHLSGSLSKKLRNQRLALIENGDVSVIVGTHAVFSETVRYHSLGLVVIDEQQRFGVSQRSRLGEKIKETISPHQLIMSATPIPRTLALVVFGDLPISIINQYPKGRKPITTAVLSQERREQVIERVKKKLATKQQVYWVCPLIETSPELEAEAVSAIASTLTKQLPDATVDLVHGKLADDIRTTTMSRFRSGLIDILVATTVIEVGVDVPNATIMVIENAERLGLSQLHQLRGRIGRGSTESFCILLHQNPLTDIAQMRLETMRCETNGFTIAKKDLELRGAGELLGTRQSGFSSFRLARLPQDIPLFNTVKPFAKELLADNPQQATALYQRWNSHDPIVQG